MPEKLVSIYMLDEMRGVSYEADGRYGSDLSRAFPHITKDPIIQEHINVLGEAGDMVGGPQIRNIRTIGGNTCNGDICGFPRPRCMPGDTIVEITGPDGVRRIPIHDFYIKGRCCRFKTGRAADSDHYSKAYEGYRGHYIKYAMKRNGYYNDGLFRQM